MVKGVNRNIIEISETGNSIFERAILFVNPSGRDREPAELEEQARRYLGKLRLRGAMLRPRVLLAAVGRYGLAALLGALAMRFFLGCG